LAEALERRVALSTATVQGGVLIYQAEATEPNAVILDRVTVAATAYIRIRDTGSGVSITPGGAPVISDGPTTIRVPASAITGVEILCDWVDELGLDFDITDDTVSVQTGGLPQSVIVNLGPDTDSGLDAGTILGTTGNDEWSVVSRRGSDGARGMLISTGAGTVLFSAGERMSFNLSQDGIDELSIDRAVKGASNSLEVFVMGGGAGEDRLNVVADGNFAQRFLVEDGRVTVQEAEDQLTTFLGPSDNIAIQQPVVTIELIEDPDPTVEGDEISIGPDPLNSVFNQFLLDTGSSGIVFSAAPVSELVGYEIAGQYLEQGIAGFELMDVSVPYRLDYAGTTGERNTIQDVQVLSWDDLFSPFGPWGILGMPAMIDKVTTLSVLDWFSIEELEDLAIDVYFGQDDPPESEHRRTVTMPLVDFGASGQLPGGPLPTFTELPYIPVRARDGGTQVDGHFLFDTGAQLTVISTQLALDLGLDRNGDGSILDDAFDSTEVSGIGGTTQVPLLALDQLSVPTNEGDDLVWTEILCAVIDIEVEEGPSLLGVFGMDLLTSGWAAFILPGLIDPTDPGSGIPGYFSGFHLDFRTDELGYGTLNFDITPEWDNTGTPSANAFVIQHTGIDVVSLAGTTTDDTFVVTPSPTVRINVDGGPHSSGDVLQISPDNLGATTDGSTIEIPGFQDIQYVDIESLIGVDEPGLRVSSVVWTESGFHAEFSQPFDALALNLYDTATAGLGPADVVVTGPSGVVSGTLIPSADSRSFEWIRTGGTLEAGLYTVLLRSAANGFHTPSGELLDGDSNSVPGGDYTTSVTSSGPSPGSVRGSITDLVRGRTQTGSITARYSEANGVTSLVFEIEFDPALLTIASASPGPGAPAGASVSLSTISSGRVRVNYTSGTPLSGNGTFDLVTLGVTLPADAPYTTKGLLDLTTISALAGATSLPAHDDDAVIVSSYPADLNADGRISSNDVTLARRLIGGLDGGFAAYQLADPRMVADFTGDGLVSSGDVTQIRRFIGSLSSTIPPLGPENPAIVGPDPRLWIPRDLQARTGERIDLPVRFEVTDPSGAGLASFDLSLEIDPSQFSVRGIRLGDLVRADFDFAWWHDSKTGRLRITGNSRTGEELALDFGDVGELIVIELAVLPRATPGQVPINLRAMDGHFWTALGDQAGRTLLLAPEPTDRSDDPIDGSLRILGPVRPSTPAVIAKGIRSRADIFLLQEAERDSASPSLAYVPAGPLGIGPRRRPGKRA
jgi:hypothetical protein